MDKLILIEKIREANASFSERVLHEVHDIQYDYEADILYFAFGVSEGNAFSVPADTDDEVYLRVNKDDHRIVGLDIMCFRSQFLPNHADAGEAFDPVFNFLGNTDWRFQVKMPTGEVALLLPARASVEYFHAYIPQAVTQLAPA